MWEYVSLAWEWLDWLLSQLTWWMDSLEPWQLALVAAGFVVMGAWLLRGFGSRTSY